MDSSRILPVSEPNPVEYLFNAKEAVVILSQASIYGQNVKNALVFYRVEDPRILAHVAPSFMEIARDSPRDFQEFIDVEESILTYVR
ncbi:hypothetical protein RB195_026453 [Necator americanus]|uniref:Uncharacterized protein n=1 Tax=Necator americanus TaxID=51031 RepID=A0ABR1EZ69_NECAM